MTKLEKMKKIHAAGFEPDLWFYTDVAKTALYKQYKENYGFKPYFTESRLWELLPDEIFLSKKMPSKATGYYDLTLIENVLGYSSKDHYGDYDYLIGFDIDKNTNLHTALIDMVLWCIENNYIGEKKL